MAAAIEYYYTLPPGGLNIMSVTFLMIVKLSWTLPLDLLHYDVTPDKWKHLLEFRKFLEFLRNFRKIFGIFLKFFKISSYLQNL